MAVIRVLLVDDNAIVRRGIASLLSDSQGIEVVGEAGDGRSALEGIEATHPAAVLLDLSMPDMNGLEAILEIRKRDPEVAIIVLSGFSADRMGPPTMERGADRYVEKGSPMDELRDATRTAVAARRGD